MIWHQKLLVLALISVLLNFLFMGRTPDWSSFEKFINEYDVRTGGGSTLSTNGFETTVDFISIGSNKRLHYLEAQKDSFRAMSNLARSNASWQVRHVLTYTEDDDPEAHCHSNLTTDQVMQVSRFCRSHKSSSFSWKMRYLLPRFAGEKWLKKKGDDMIGWMCAQKRLPESLAAGLKTYKNTSNLPDYLLLIDDDTYINLPLMIPELRERYPSDQAYTAAGCLVALDKHGFPWGGFGTIYTRKSLERFLQPLECSFQNSAEKVKQLEANVTIQSYRDLTPNEFETLACDKINSNLIGERDVYQMGMTLADLLQAYMARWNYTSVKTWDQLRPGLCLHSDWIVGYWINSFYIARQWGGSLISNKAEDRIHPYLQSDLKKGGPNSQCPNNGDEQCTNQSHICHHVSSEKILAWSKG